MAKAIAVGDVSQALNKLSANGGIHWSAEKGESMQQLIECWSKDIVHHPLSAVLMVARSNRDVRILNGLAREVLKERGLLAKDEYQCESIHGKILISSGDRIEFRKNDPELGVTNGMSGTLVQASEKEFVVAIDSEKEKKSTIKFDPHHFQSFQLGYASTYYRSQGQTVDRAYVLHSQGLNKKEFYVGITRHIKTVHFFVSRDQAKSLSHLKWHLKQDKETPLTIQFTTQEKIDLDIQTRLREQSHQDLKASDNFLTRLSGHSRSIWNAMKQQVGKYYQAKKDLAKNHEFYNPKIETTKRTCDVTPVPHTETTEQAAKQADKKEVLKPAISEEKMQLVQEYRNSVKEISVLREIVSSEAESQGKEMKELARFKELQKAWNGRDQKASTLIKGLSLNELHSIFGEKNSGFIVEQAERFEYFQEKAHQKIVSNEELEKKLLDNIENLLYRLFPDGPSRRESGKLRYGKKGSLCVTISGSKAGCFYDFESQEGGGLLKLISKSQNCSKEESKQWAKEFLDISHTIDVPQKYRTSQEKEIRNESGWIAIQPNNSNPPKKLYKINLGKEYQETTRYSYRDSDGNLLFYVVRLVDKEGAKVTLPLSYGHWKNRPERFCWSFKQYATAERPLYNLHLLKEHPNKPILIVEGEKAADAASKQFTDFVVISWSGGSGAVSKTDWRPLIRKEIVIWPDNDKAGFKAANQICAELKRQGVKKLGLVDTEKLTKEFPEKWDLADPLPSGKTQQTIQDMITSSKEVAINPEQLLFRLDEGVPHPARLARVNEILWRVDERMRDQLEEKHGNKFWEVNGEIVREAVKILANEKEIQSKIHQELGIDGILKERIAYQALLSIAQHGKAPPSSYLELVKEKIRDAAWIQEVDQKIKQSTDDKEIRSFVIDKTISDLIGRSSTQTCLQKEAIHMATELSRQVQVDRVIQMENSMCHSRQLDVP
jgi:hypothetical protein